MNSKTNKASVLILERRGVDREGFMEDLSEEGFEVHGIVFPSELEEAISKINPDVIVFGVAFAKHNGDVDEIETYNHLTEAGVLMNRGVVFMTLRSEEKLLSTLKATGRPVFKMPEKTDVLLKLIKKELKKRK